MVALKATEIKRLIEKPSSYHAYLIYGPDQGLITERALKLSKALAKKAGETAEEISLLNEDLATSPERLTIDLKTISMFGERRILRVSAGKDLSLPALESLLKETPLEGDLIIEAGDLKKTHRLRKLFEGDKSLAAIPCYMDSAADLKDLVREVLGFNNLTIDSESESYLISRLGADHALSRGEVEKLALYAHGKTQVTIKEIDEILGDMSDITIDDIITNTLLGRPAKALNELRRATAAGLNTAPIFLSLLRQLHQLHKGALSVAAGNSIHAVTKAQRPPLYFERRDNFSHQLNLWKEDHLAHALSKTQTIMGTARRRNNPELEVAELEQLLLTLAAFISKRAT
jgi:DNA polymerase-3 subunit delta